MDKEERDEEKMRDKANWRSATRPNGSQLPSPSSLTSRPSPPSPSAHSESSLNNQISFGEDKPTSKTCILSNSKPKSEATDRSESSMEWAILPRACLPPDSEYFPVEKFVNDAIISRHAQAEGGTGAMGLAGYKAILDLLRKQDDIPMLTKVLLALRTGGNGNTMGRICSEMRIHSNLLHLIFRIDPFKPRVNGNVNTSSIGEINKEKGKRKEETLNKCDNSLPDAYLNLILALVSANSVFLAPTLNAMWRLIMNTEPALPDGVHLFANKDSVGLSDDINTVEKVSKDDSAEDDLESDYHMRQVQRNSRLHGTLSKILRLVPKGRVEIFPIIASNFPFKLAPLSKQISYLKQCLIVLRYVPTMEEQFLHLCVDQSLEIDVEIRISDSGLVQIDEEKEKDECDLECNKDDPAKIDDKTDREEDLKRLEKEKSEEQKVNEMAEKLDIFMLLIYRYIKSSSNQDTKAIQLLYNIIIPVFNSVILTTHRSKFVQFIILYLCGLDHDALENKDEHNGNVDCSDQLMERPKLYRAFASKLINIIIDPYCSTLKRQSATCYLASFVSRASFVCTETACEAIAALLRFAEAYMETFPTKLSARNAFRRLGDGATRSGGRTQVEKHSLFYTVCQAAFYIMCFRGADCIRLCRKESIEQRREEEFDIDISTDRWTRLCSHHLQPLRFCLESVRGEFLFLCKIYYLVEDNILAKLVDEDRQMASGFERSKSRRCSQIKTAALLEKKRRNGTGGLGKGKNPLDSFFPFDPYLLYRSFKFIEPYYRQWEGNVIESDVITMDEDMNSESDSDQEISDDEDGSLATNIVSTPSLSDDELKEDMSDHGDSDDEDTSQYNDLEDNVGGSDRALLVNPAITDNTSMGRNSWVQELKRPRAYSVAEDCW